MFLWQEHYLHGICQLLKRINAKETQLALTQPSRTPCSVIIAQQVRCEFLIDGIWNHFPAFSSRLRYLFRLQNFLLLQEEARCPQL